MVVPRSERAVCVTGMHRSGTSFTARVLELLGVYWGSPDRLMAPGPDNPVGYWENRDLKELNDELLAHLGGSWDLPPVFNPGWEQASGLDLLRKRASDILDDAFGTSRLEQGIIGWKDPRLSLLLPFWRTVTPVATTIVVVRDPLEVAASLRARNGIDAPQAMMLWLTYLYAAVANDPGCLIVARSRLLCRLAANTFGHSRLRRASSAHAGHNGSSSRAPRSVIASSRGHWPRAHGKQSTRCHGVRRVERRCRRSGAHPRGRCRRRSIGMAATLRSTRNCSRARAEVITMRDRIRQRRRQERAAQDLTPPDTEPGDERSPVPIGDGSGEIEDGEG